MDPRALIGVVIDEKFELLQLAGSGGMGSVFRAKQLGLERSVAVKILHKTVSEDDELAARFEREAHALATLTHINIGTFYSYGVWNYTPYIAMEYLTGTNLKQIIQTEGKLPWQRAIRIVVQVCNAMDYAHKANVIHRDLSPNNLLVSHESGAELVKIIDFGLAKVLAPSKEEIHKLTKTGTLLGSVHYMSPELSSGKAVDFRSDIYSLACILYECLTGVTPFSADNAIGVLHKQVNEEPESLTEKGLIEIPEGLEAILSRGMAKAADARYQTMAEMRDDLALVLSGQGANSSSFRNLEGSKQEKSKARQSQKLFLPLSVSAFILVLLLIPLLYYTESGLNLASGALLLGKTDQARLNLLLSVLGRLEELHADSSAASLRRRIFQSQEQMGSLGQQLMLCRVFAEQLHEAKKDKEAETWVWMGLRKLATVLESAATESSKSSKLLAALNLDDSDLVANTQRLVSLCSAVRVRPNAARLAFGRSLGLSTERLKGKKLLAPIYELNAYLLSFGSNKLAEKEMLTLLFFNRLDANDLQACDSVSKKLFALYDANFERDLGKSEKLVLKASYAVVLIQRGQSPELKDNLKECIFLIDSLTADLKLSDIIAMFQVIDLSQRSGDLQTAKKIAGRLNEVFLSQRNPNSSNMELLHNLVDANIVQKNYERAREITDVAIDVAARTGGSAMERLQLIAKRCFSDCVSARHFVKLDELADKLIARSEKSGDKKSVFHWSLEKCKISFAEGKFQEVVKRVQRIARPENTLDFLELSTLQMNAYRSLLDEASADKLYPKLRDAACAAKLETEAVFDTVVNLYCDIKRAKGNHLGEKKVIDEYIQSLRKANANEIPILQWQWRGSNCIQNLIERESQQKLIVEAFIDNNWNPNEVAAYIIEYANLLLRLGNPDEARGVFTRALKLRTNADKKTLILVGLLNLGIVQRDREEITKYGAAVLKELPKTSNPVTRMLAYTQLALAVRLTGQVELEKAYFRKAIENADDYPSNKEVLRKSLEMISKTMPNH